MRLRQRGFKVEDRRLLAILDGADALRKAIKEFWPDAVVQSCLIHKERNLHRYLRKSDHAECSVYVLLMAYLTGENGLRGERNFHAVGVSSAARLAGQDGIFGSTSRR